MVAGHDPHDFSQSIAENGHLRLDLDLLGPARQQSICADPAKEVRISFKTGHPQALSVAYAITCQHVRYISNCIRSDRSSNSSFILLQLITSLKASLSQRLPLFGRHRRPALHVTFSGCMLLQASLLHIRPGLLLFRFSLERSYDLSLRMLFGFENGSLALFLFGSLGR